MRYKKQIILFLAFLLVLKVLSCRLVDYNTKELQDKCPQMSTLTVITEGELEKFLPLWREYMQNGLDKEVPDKVSLLSENFAEKLPVRVQVWFNKNCWTAERFYYVEQRLQAVLRTLYLQQHTNEVKKVLSEQIKRETDETRIATYQDMINMQDKIANVENVTNQEVELVTKLRPQIESVINFKSVN